MKRFVIVLGAALPGFVWGHHGWSGYHTEEFELTGTVQEDVSLSGPHATMQIVDAEGQVCRWDARSHRAAQPAHRLWSAWFPLFPRTFRVIP